MASQRPQLVPYMFDSTTAERERVKALPALSPDEFDPDKNTVIGDRILSVGALLGQAESEVALYMEEMEG